MIIPRGLYNDSPPERRSRVTNNPTLLYSWWCTIFSVVIIGFRLSGRYIRNERLFREDKIMAWSVLPLLARMGFVHVVLIYGTNNVDLTGLVDPVKIRRREIGSQMVLAARIFYAMFIWMAKFTVSEFLKRLTERFWKKGYEWGLRGIRIFLVATFIMVFIATLAECHPVTHYWQVIPDPGPQCRQGYAQLLTMGITDIITDILLVAFPIPIIIKSGMPLKRKLSLIGLFSMSIILIIVTAARMPAVIDRQGLQQFRTVFASSEILTAAIVSNAIILGSFLRDRGLKKPKFKAPSTTDSMERRGSARRYTNQPCSSDEDLARSLGFRTKPELTETASGVPRPAPVADLDLLSSNGKPGPFTNDNWQFPGQALNLLQMNGDSNLKVEDIRDPMPSPRGGRRVSWFDVGGLLDNSTVAPSPTDSVITHDFASQPRRSSRASNSIMSNGRAYPPPARRSSRLSQQSEDYEMSVRPSNQLQDPGGLLSEDREQEEAQSSPSPTSGSSYSLPQRNEQGAFIQRHSTQTSDDSPSLQDAGGLLSSPSNHP
ncbi:Nn.00g044480.m01.CDS01 [Neocucurbitaria sp. VM-36]